MRLSAWVCVAAILTACAVLRADQVVVRRTPPLLLTISPSSGAVAATVTITGTNFGTSQENSALSFNGTLATASSWSDTSITVLVPVGATTGNVTVTRGGQTSNALAFTVNASSASTPCTDAANLSNAIYIRQGAGGTNTGANWTNALTTPPTTLTRGKTYCVADTTTGFGQWAIDTHSTSTTVTTIVKATIADHGTSTGWLDTMGDGQAVFTGSQTFQGTFDYNVAGSGYLTVDGNGTAATCGAIPALRGASQTGCGFKFIDSATGAGMGVNVRSTGSHFIFRYIETQGPSGTSTSDFTYSADSFGVADWGNASEFTLQYSYVHNNVTNIDCLFDNLTIEYNFITNSLSSLGGAHSNVIFVCGDVNGGDIRHNYLKNFNDEGIFLTFQGNAGGGPLNVRVYGNVGYSPGTTNPRGFELRQASSAGDAVYSGIVVNNNTFADLSLGGVLDRSGEAPGGSCTGCSASNNLSVNAGNSFTNMTTSNNTSDTTTSRFVSYPSDFHLTGALAGTSLASPYTTDLLGNTRGADGTWERGAYEFCSGGCTFASLLDLLTPQAYARAEQQQPTRRFWSGDRDAIEERPASKVVVAERPSAKHEGVRAALRRGPRPVRPVVQRQRAITSRLPEPRRGDEHARAVQDADECGVLNLHVTVPELGKSGEGRSGVELHGLEHGGFVGQGAEEKPAFLCAQRQQVLLVERQHAEARAVINSHGYGIDHGDLAADIADALVDVNGPSGQIAGLETAVLQPNGLSRRLTRHQHQQQRQRARHGRPYARRRPSPSLGETRWKVARAATFVMSGAA